MRREEIERKFRESVGKMNEAGGLNAIAYALMAVADVMNRGHDLARKQIEKMEEMQEGLKKDMDI